VIRAAFDVHVIGQRATGNETYAEGLMRAFDAQPPSDVDLYFYHSSAGGSGIGGRRRRIWPDTPYLRVPLATPFWLLRDRIDVAHFQYFAPPVCSSKVVLTVHDLSFERFPEYFTAGFTRRMRAMMPWMARNAVRVIAVSGATKLDLMDLYGIPEDRIDVIYNGASEHFRPEPDRERLAALVAGMGITRPFIVCVGNMCRRKNQARVVRAFAHLVRERGIEHDLVLVGKEEHSAREVRAEIAHADIPGRVHVPGFVSREQLVALYNLATFSVYTSHYEGFGLPIVESMACGTPVLTSSVSCVPEIAGEAALLVDPSDDDAIAAGMERMLEDTALRDRLREAGLARSRDFTWSEAADRTLATYRRAMAS